MPDFKKSNVVYLKRGEDRRIRAGNPWVFSNEIDNSTSPLKSFSPGEEVVIASAHKSLLGSAYINPHSLIAARIFSRDPNGCLDINFFKQQINSALDLRSALFTKPYYRLVFGEADGLPGLVVDRFGHDLVLQINTAGMEQKQDVIIKALLSVLPDTSSILMRNDNQFRTHEGLTTYVKSGHGNPPEEIILEENNVRFFVPLWKGQKTGWFYDHRMNRAGIAKYVKNKTVLDVFSYLGAWGIQALCFGAKHVDFIEASAFACDFILRNATLNSVASQTNILCDDAFAAMKSLLHSDQKYDVIILDPPAFVKKLKDRKEGLIAYQRLNELALKLLVPNGVLVSCSCSMHVSMEDLIHILKKCASQSHNKTQILERGHQGPDHPIHLFLPETDYLKAITVRKLET